MSYGKKADRDEFQEILERFDLASTADNINRAAALDDIKFALVPGNQWEEHQKRARGKRPCYEFNKVRQHIRQVTNDQRQNRPGIKVRATDSKTDPKLAEILTGHIRNIESQSNAERAYDTAFEYAVSGGYGCWRVVKEYSDDSSFEQELRIKEIRNPFAVHFDQTAQEWDCRDGWFAFVSEMMPKDEYERLYPGKEVSSFETSLGTRQLQWLDKDTVRVAEYWCRKPVQKTLLMFSNGEVVEKTPEIESVLDEMAATGKVVVSERVVESSKVEMYLVSGAGILSGPHKWEGKYIPIVPVWGDKLNIEGREIYSGMVRFTKDPQRTHNYHRTVAIEMVSLAPKSPFIGTKKMFEGLGDIWNKFNEELLAWLPYNPDPSAPGAAPQRSPAPEVPTALMALSAQDVEDIKSSTGQYNASLGDRSNETSGRAIMARQREGDVATFNYIDNLGRAIKFTGEILVDIIPKIYDTERSIRVMGEDGKEDYAVLNQTVLDQQTRTPVIVNDLSKAKFDVSVSVGPSYTTQRMETAEAMLQIANSNTPDAVIARYLALKSLDIPGSDELLKAMRKMLVQQGLLEPGPDEEPPQPPQPDPKMVAEIHKTLAQTEGIQLDNAKKAQDVQEAPLDSDLKEAQLMGTILENFIKAGRLGIGPGGRLMMMDQTIQ
jgi:hypothetical protein